MKPIGSMTWLWQAGALGVIVGWTWLAEACPCNKGCADTACWEATLVFNDGSTQTQCNVARDPFTGAWVETAWLDTWDNPAIGGLRALTGFRCELWRYPTCFGICSAQGCATGNDTEEGSSSCDGTPFYLLTIDQKVCVPGG